MTWEHQERNSLAFWTSSWILLHIMCEIRTRSEAEWETYSIETQLNIKRRRGAVPVPKVIRTDQTDH